MAEHVIVERRTHRDYHVGWICALSKEQTAATAMLDIMHHDLPSSPRDSNTYTLGSIGQHNVVIACLPEGQYGTISAATVATHMLNTFPAIRFCLLVGIGGGLPKKVRLGDVVVGIPTGELPGVVQWDLGKATSDGFKRVGSLNSAPTALKTAVSKLRTQHEKVGSKVSAYLEKMSQDWPRLKAKYLRSEAHIDRLFRADYCHVEQPLGENDLNSDEDDSSDGEEENDCKYCDKSKSRVRKPVASGEFKVHYGLIASGNQVIKNATFRDKLNTDLGGQVLCFEMEAAGLMNEFPCMVIRGICDYADSHKAKVWQEHAAAVAAAYAKELLNVVQMSEVEQTAAARDILKHVEQINENMEELSRRMDEGFKDSKEGLTSLSIANQSQWELEVLEWLTSVDYGNQQHDFYNRLEPNTGRWLFDSNELQIWLADTKQTLFCPGAPGAGKTMQTAVLVNHLYQKFGNDGSICIAYIYCNYQRQVDQIDDKLFACLVKQLARRQKPLPDCVKALYQRHKDAFMRPSLQDLSSVAYEVAAVYERIFIVVDAIDECEDVQQNRSKFLGEVFAFQEKTGANILVTSRAIPQIEILFKDSLTIPIRPSRDDVFTYLSRHMSELPDFVQVDSDLQTEIKTEIETAIDGIFLLLPFYVDSLIGKRSPAAIRKALQDLRRPSKSSETGTSAYDEIYDKAMQRIQFQKGDLPKDARMTLSWLVHAKEQLTVLQLRHALAVEIGKGTFDSDNLPSAGHIIKACAPLVTIDEESKIVRLAHYTIQEYLVKNQDRWLPLGEAYITDVCVTHLSLNQFDNFEIDWMTRPELYENGFQHFHLVEEYMRDLMSRFPLYRYAANYWGHHARMGLPLSPNIFTFLKHAAYIHFSSQVMDDFMSRLSSKVDRYRRASWVLTTPLHLSAYFDLLELMNALVADGFEPDSRDSAGRTPLSWAAELGHYEIVRSLVEKPGVDCDSVSSTCKNYSSRVHIRTPLSFAAEKGHYAVVELLLKQSNVNADSVAWDAASRTGTGRTPLSFAAENGHVAVVKLLLANQAVDADRGVEGNWKDEGRTPLSFAAERGHIDIVKLLLAQPGVNPESVCTISGRTPLFVAAENGHTEICELLLQYPNVKPDRVAAKEGFDGRTALSFAAENSHRDVVELLLKQPGVNSESKSTSDWMHDRTPLSYAARRGDEAIVEMLLAQPGSNPLSVSAAFSINKDWVRGTPLSMAIEAGYERIVELLRAHPDVTEKAYASELKALESGYYQSWDP